MFMLLSPQMLMYAYAHRCTYTHVLTDALIHMCSQMQMYTAYMYTVYMLE